jgi:hypothetical protein
MSSNYSKLAHFKEIFLFGKIKKCKSGECGESSNNEVRFLAKMRGKRRGHDSKSTCAVKDLVFLDERFKI